MFAFGDKEWPGIAKLNEEAGELVQVIGKLMMTHGRAAHWDGSNLRERFVKELADVAAAVAFVEMHVLTEEERVHFEERGADKSELFEKWHAEQTPRSVQEVAELHENEKHPGYEYETTTGPRKAFIPVMPDDKPGWELNTSKGRDGWERFDEHEEAYWMRKRS